VQDSSQNDAQRLQQHRRQRLNPESAHAASGGSPSPVTIRDLAKYAGVSTGTISRALKNEPGLTEHTRQMVLTAAHELGYDFCKLRRKRIRRLTFLLHRQHNTAASSPFYSPVLHGAEEACRKQGIVLSFMAVGPADGVNEQLRMHAPDAIVCAGFFEPELLEALRASGKPMVLIDMKLRGYSSVNPDNHMGGYLATRHLLGLGRERIAMISGPLSHYSVRERNRGYRQALFEAGILADPRLDLCLPDGARPRSRRLRGDAVAAGPAASARRRVLLQRQPPRWWRCAAAWRMAARCRTTSRSSASTTSRAPCWGTVL
jgi:transcriptional regulator with XRE-family HTH domain